MAKDKLRPEKEPGGPGGDHCRKSPQGEWAGASIHHNRAHVTRVCKRGRWIRWSQRGGKGLGTGYEGRGLTSHPLSLSKCNMKAQRVLSSGLTQLCGTKKVSE